MNIEREILKDLDKYPADWTYSSTRDQIFSSNITLVRTKAFDIMSGHTSGHEWRIKVSNYLTSKVGRRLNKRLDSIRTMTGVNRID